MDRPRAVVEGEDDEVRRCGCQSYCGLALTRPPPPQRRLRLQRPQDSACSDDGQQGEQQHDTHGGSGGEPGEQGEGGEAGNSHDGGSRGQEGSAHPARLHVTLTQNQLKLCAWPHLAC